MKTLLKNAREAKGLKTRELALLSGIDQALISKFENGSRTPTKPQAYKICEILNIDSEQFILVWLKEKILNLIADEPLALQSLKAAEAEILKTQTEAKPDDLQSLVREFDALKSKLDKAIKG